MKWRKDLSKLPNTRVWTLCLGSSFYSRQTKKGGSDLTGGAASSGVLGLSVMVVESIYLLVQICRPEPLRGNGDLELPVKRILQ